MTDMLIRTRRQGWQSPSLWQHSRVSESMRVGSSTLPGGDSTLLGEESFESTSTLQLKPWAQVTVGKLCAACVLTKCPDQTPLLRTSDNPNVSSSVLIRIGARRHSILC